MEQVEPRCSVCGEPARVRILENYVAGRPVVRPFCFRCADVYSREATREMARPGHRSSLGLLMIVAGLTIGMVALAGDYVGIRGLGGVGWYKQFGVLLGILFVCLGAFWRIDVIGLVGGLLIALVFSAKLLHLAGAEGFGWKHQAALAVGLLLIIAGVVVRQFGYRRVAGKTRGGAAGRGERLEN